MEETLRGIHICNYSAMAALAFTVYDMILTIRPEVDHIWRGSWTNLKSLYLFIRWFSLIAQIIPMVITLKLAAGAMTESPTRCLALMSIQAMSSQVILLCVQLILILRVQALYYSFPNLRRVLLALYFVEILSMIIIFSLSAKRIEYSISCTVISLPETAIGYLLIPMLFECFLFSLTIYKFWKAVRNGWGQETVLARFMRDGIWAFALPFLIFLVNNLTMALDSGTLSTLAYSWVLAIPGFCGYRLILNMSHLLRPQPPDSLDDEFPTEGRLDTFPMTIPASVSSICDEDLSSVSGYVSRPLRSQSWGHRPDLPPSPPPSMYLLHKK